MRDNNLLPFGALPADAHDDAFKTRHIYWAFLMERCEYDQSFKMGMILAWRAGRLAATTPNAYIPILNDYERTDTARMRIVNTFRTLCMENGRNNPKDTLVMLDIDHRHPKTIIADITKHDVPVVVPLMFRRGDTHEACAFVRGEDNQLHHIMPPYPEPRGLMRVNAIGSGAIAIQRHVYDTFDRLDLGGGMYYQYRYLRNEDGSITAPSEDLFFSELCELADVAMYVDSTFQTPHLTIGEIDEESHLACLADHPELMNGAHSVNGFRPYAPETNFRLTQD